MPCWKRGRVYFVRDPATCAIKIGFSTDVEQRVTALRTYSATPLEFMGVLVGSSDLERFLHNHFRAVRVQGEWFEDTEAMRAAIAGLLQDGPESIGYKVRVKPEPPPPKPDPEMDAIMDGVRSLAAKVKARLGHSDIADFLKM